MKILILGGSSHIINKLSEVFLNNILTSQIDVVGNIARKIIKHKKVRLLNGDLENNENINFNAEYDIVIDMLTRTKDEISHYLSKIQKIKKLIYISSFQVYRFLNKKNVLTEDLIESNYINYVEEMVYSSNKIMDIYACEKLKSEQIIKRNYNEKIDNYIIIRPGKLLSRLDDTYILSWILSRIKKNYPIILKKSYVLDTNIFSIVFLRDIIRFIQFFINHEVIDNGIYNICQDRMVSLVDIIRICKDYYRSNSELFVLDDEEFKDGYLLNYVSPMQEAVILSNAKVKKDLGFYTHDFDENFHLLLRDFKIIANKRILNIENEKEYIEGNRIINIGARQIKSF